MTRSPHLDKVSKLLCQQDSVWQQGRVPSLDRGFHVQTCFTTLSQCPSLHNSSENSEESYKPLQSTSSLSLTHAAVNHVCTCGLSFTHAAVNHVRTCHQEQATPIHTVSSAISPSAPGKPHATRDKAGQSREESTALANSQSLPLTHLTRAESGEATDHSYSLSVLRPWIIGKSSVPE